MKKAIDNPFPISGYQGPEYFCNREEEVKLLREALMGGRNVTLVALRRVGKTALVHHLFHELASKTKWLLLYADLMPTSSLAEFTAKLTTALAQAYPETTSMGKKIWSWIKTIRPQISFDSYSGLPQISFDITRTQEQQATLHQLFTLLEKSGTKTVLVLDEFQQITQYPEKKTEAWLRSEIQNLTSVNFIFCGSQQQVIAEMFNSTKRPFYASTQMLTLPLLENKTYHHFIAKHMKKAAKLIKAEDIDYLLNWCRSHTYYVQLICNRIFASEEKNLSRDFINLQMEKILKEQEPVFFTFRELLTTSQWNFLTAVAKEKRVYAPTAQIFIRTHDLGTPAAVKRSLDSLLLKEMIYRQFDAEGKSFYQVYDVFLSRWLERKL